MAGPTDTLPEGVDADLFPTALLKLDRRRRIRGVNSEAEFLLQTSREVLRGRSLTDLFYHDCDLFALIDRAEETRGRVTSIGLRLDGPGVAAKNQTAIVDHLSDETFAVALITGPEANAATQDAPGLAAFGRILGHEVKNPLAGISGATQLLMRDAREDQTELLDMVLAESRRIERLINELSAFELFSAPRCEPCNVHEVLDRVIKAEEMALGPNITLRRVFDPSLPDLYADADHLHEAFQNLIRNAGESIADSRRAGQIRVLTRFAIDRRIQQPKPGQSGRMMKVVVEDNGPGIAEKSVEKIFNMFHTTKPNGSGLGLTVVSQVIAAHDGSIELDSLPGRTRFSIYLPIAGGN
ncbi:MAG: ATP-binding protein [Pseudomonadota bacterium]